MDAEKLVDAETAKRALGVTDQELTALVADGRLRAFRSEGRVKFHADDVLERANAKSRKVHWMDVVLNLAGILAWLAVLLGFMWMIDEILLSIFAR